MISLTCEEPLTVPSGKSPGAMVIEPLNVALPSELKVIPPPSEPICIDVGVIWTLLFESLPIVTVVPLTLTKSVVWSFSFKELLVISTCSVPLFPILVVEANSPTPPPLWLIIKPLALNTALLLESLITLTSSVEAEIWALLVLPNVAPYELNLLTTVLESFMDRPVVSIKICSAADKPTRAVEPNEATVFVAWPLWTCNPLEFTTALCVESSITLISTVEAEMWAPPVSPITAP